MVAEFVPAGVPGVGARRVPAGAAPHTHARGAEAALQHQERLRHASGAHTATQR